MTRDRANAAAERVVARCREIATYTEVKGETTRPFLCESAREVQRLVMGWMTAAGMSVRLDNAGNLRALYEAGAEHARPLLIGSHLDTVPNAGAFDGVMGVLLGVAVVEELRGERLPFAIEVIGFSEEEGVRFGRPFLGSMALVGRLDRPMLDIRDAEGIGVGEALRGFGLDPARLDEAMADAGAIGFLEVHIEQGPVLENEACALGVVDAIAGQSRLLLRFRGRSNHAGTTPMLLRQDALAAAAEWVGAVERMAQATAGLVATVGRLETRPGATNVIAGEVTASLDVRHAADAVRCRAVQSLVEIAHEAGRRRAVAVEVETTLEQAAVPLSAEIATLLDRAVKRCGYEARHLVSGAGHDAMIMAEKMPSGMLFVRSPGGVSHHPDETVLIGDVAAAIETLMEVVMELRGDCLAKRVTQDA